MQDEKRLMIWMVVFGVLFMFFVIMGKKFLAIASLLVTGGMWWKRRKLMKESGK